MSKNVKTEWDLRKLQLSLEKKAPSAIYVLHGEEIFLVDEALKAIKNKVLSSSSVDFNYDSLIAPENTAGQVRDVIETLPVMCEQRLVVYKNIETLKDDAWEELSHVFTKPISSTVLVLVATKLDKRKKFVKNLQNHAVFVELKKPYENQISYWIDYIAYLNNVSISSEAKIALQELVGTNLSELSNEILKICQFIGDKKSSEKTCIEINHVLEVVSRSRVENIFSLTEAIGQRDRSKALVCLANLLEHGQSEVGIAALIHRQIRILSAVCDAKKQGLSGIKLSQKIGVPDFFMKQYLEQAQLWDKEKLVAAVRALHETDKAIKSSPVSSHIWLENFILRTC
jgi:DNA polymerase-3 subunit delta